MGTVIDLDTLALKSDVLALDDADLLYVLFVTTSPGEDGVLLNAARSQRLAKHARVATAEVCRRFVPDEVVAEAFEKLELDD